MKKTLYLMWLLTSLLLWVARGSAQQPSSEPSDSPDDMPKETELNTASLTTTDGKTFKLVVIGDCLPQLFINGEKINKNDFLFHEEQIEQLKEVIAERQMNEERRLQAYRDRVKNQMIADIVGKNLAGNKDDIKSYYLTSRKLMVNGKIADPDTFIFFRNKYIKSADTVLYYERERVYSFHKSAVK